MNLWHIFASTYKLKRKQHLLHQLNVLQHYFSATQKQKQRPWTSCNQTALDGVYIVSQKILLLSECQCPVGFLRRHHLERTILHNVDRNIPNKQSLSANKGFVCSELNYNTAAGNSWMKSAAKKIVYSNKTVLACTTTLETCRSQWQLPQCHTYKHLIVESYLVVSSEFMLDRCHSKFQQGQVSFHNSSATLQRNSKV